MGEAQHGLLGLWRCVMSPQMPRFLDPATSRDFRASEIDRLRGNRLPSRDGASSASAARPAAMRGFDERDEGPPFIAVAPPFDVGGIMEQDRRMSAHELLGGPAEDSFGRGIGMLDDATGRW